MVLLPILTHQEDHIVHHLEIEGAVRKYVGIEGSQVPVPPPDEAAAGDIFAGFTSGISLWGVFFK